MKLSSKLFLGLLVGLVFAGCSSRNTDTLQKEMQGMDRAYKHIPGAPMLEYDDPAFVCEPHLFTYNNAAGDKLQVQIYDPGLQDWVQINNVAPKHSIDHEFFYYSFMDLGPGTYELQVQNFTPGTPGGGSFTDGFFITVENCCEDRTETAWAHGDPYNTGGGNWATYTAYDGLAKSVLLNAGQNEDAGTVDFSAPDINGDVTITVNLANGWEFQDDPENVKIQDYEDAPAGNPSPGQFDHKGEGTGSSFFIVVPENDFYGVHVDVKICE